MSDGEIIVDDYQLLKCIATGNYSQVWEVVPKGGAKRIAMKLLLPEAFKESGQVQILKHEARVAKSLDHPNIIRFQEMVANKKRAYMLMDYFPALNLKLQAATDRVSIHARIRKLVESLCQTIGYMHEHGWLHRDIKPDNILFNKSSELRLIDFSLSSRYAKGIGKLFFAGSKNIQGTRTYIAPETILKKAPSPQTDMYSLGITLYEILTGGAPFRGSTPDELLARHLKTTPLPPSDYNRNLTPELDEFVMRMLKKKPKDRYKTMDEMAAQFRNMKVFNRDVVELEEELQKERDERQRQSLDEAIRLDSRSDALRSDLQKKGVLPKAANSLKKSTAKKPKPVAGRVVKKQSPSGASPGPAGLTPQKQKSQTDDVAPQQPAAGRTPQEPQQPQPSQPPQAPQPVPQGYYQYPYGVPQAAPGSYPQAAMPQYPPGYVPQQPGVPAAHPQGGMPQYPQGVMPGGYPQGMPMPPQQGMPPQYPQGVPGAPPQTMPPQAQQSPSTQPPPPTHQHSPTAQPAPAQPPLQQIPSGWVPPPVDSQQPAPTPANEKPADANVPVMDELPPIKRESDEKIPPTMDELPPVD